MAKQLGIEELLKNGSRDWNAARRDGKVGVDHTGATFVQLFSANADLSALELVGSEWEKCDLTKVSFKDADLTNAYFHGGRLQDCDFRGCKVDGATFEKMKILRCDFTGAQGLDGMELDDVDMDRVTGINGEDAPPPPPPPAIGVTSFTREQRTNAPTGSSHSSTSGEELPPFRPFDPPGALLFRGLKNVGQPPVWVLDVPGLRPPLPGRLTIGTTLESLYREAVKTRLENRRPVPDSQAVDKARAAITAGSADSHFAAMYLHEVGEAPKATVEAVGAVAALMQTEMEAEDLTGALDPRVAGALWLFGAREEVNESIGELRMRAAAVQLFSALLEAGFYPDNNWEEALESQESAVELAQAATNGDRALLSSAFKAFAELPDEAKLRRLAYLAESATHLEALVRGEDAP